MANQSGMELLPVEQNEDNYDKPDAGAKSAVVKVKRPLQMELVQVCICLIVAIASYLQSTQTCSSYLV